MVFFGYIRYTGVSIKKNQFLIIIFIDIGNLIIIPIEILEKIKIMN